MRLDSMRFPGATLAVASLLVILATPALGQRSLEEVGDSLYAHFDNTEALDAYRKASELSPSFEVMFKRAVAANDIAQDLQAAGRKDEAEEAFQLAVDYAVEVRDAYPEEAGSWFILAATTGKMAQFSGGKSKVRIGRAVEEYYKKSLSLDSAYALSYMVGGIFSREVSQLNWLQRLAANTLFGGIPDGSLEESRSLLERAIELDPTLFMAHWELAQTLEALDETELANKHRRFLLVLSPRNTEERRIRSKVLEMLPRNTVETQAPEQPSPH